MNKTIAFIRLDFITVKPYISLKNILIVLLVFVFTGFGTDSYATGIAMVMMLGVIYISYPFAVCDKNGIDTLYATLPLRKRDIVAGRYIFSLCMNMITATVAFLMSVLFMAIRKNFKINEVLFIIIILFILYTVLGSIQLPIFFKMGYTKSKALSYLPLAAFPLLVMAAQAIIGKENLLPFIEQVMEWINDHRIFAILLIAAIWVCTGTVSFIISCKGYNKREF